MVDESIDEYLDIVERTFGSEDDGFEFYNSYALEKGFSVRKSYVEWDEANEEIILRKFVCSRKGSREEKHMKREDRKRRPRNLTRVGCRAKLVVARVKETGCWFVKDFIDEHTHPLAPRDLACLLRSHRKISDEQKADIVEMEISELRKHKIMDILVMQYGGYDEVGCTTRDIYNFCHLYKQETVAAGDAQTVIRDMMARQEIDSNFFFKYLVDGEGHLKGFFWADSQSRLDYEVFGNVVVFDSTYRTNKYNLPFVGLNHHRNTVVFGCGIISHETSKSYEWMLRTFSAAMAQKHPISVITDGDLAMQRAIKEYYKKNDFPSVVFQPGGR
ncbi:protein FAR1-RELATED SEQUENCE 5-like [Brachypodium distachyon]|uniref:protein FAR1-RELATED SEQUENCE 5-like n=1 Tax=Brachypodium distachyon TaxID=15368 RepID=UPI00071DD07D|nr:protein FAR1-RELATED SEQUENCE 5-like [Brachypodium distachyon]|eukprot:XP_014751141.1 protein FAR1-RELATED SEQUENCE 5-like [Brachypodium distachyon]